MGQQRLVIEGSARGKVNSALRLGHVLRRRDLTKLPGRIFAKSVLLVSLLLWLQTRIGVLLLVVGYGEKKNQSIQECRLPGGTYSCYNTSIELGDLGLMQLPARIIFQPLGFCVTGDAFLHLPMFIHEFSTFSISF